MTRSDIIGGFGIIDTRGNRDMATAITVDSYLADLPAPQRAVLEQLRATIREAVPEAVETISYQMPAFKLHGRFLVSFAAFEKHCSLFPANDRVRAVLGDALTPYLHGKGTLRFTVADPIPAVLVKDIVATRVAEVEELGPRRS
jgi:uncharacterized protein YdhG (YjbR/CyaY superfamily)